MKIGIVIGVENYNNYPDKKLTASKNDSVLMETLLSKSKAFDDLLVINEETIIAKQLKEKIEAFLSKYKNEEEVVEELFFYFSGHGMFHENEFYYICSDYNEGRKRTTSLENKELDNYIKSVNPKLTVKVVDACHSGVSYIKDIGDSLKTLEKNFDKCYFMFSSETAQSSFANENISFFTKSFLKCIIENANSRIRYKEIIDFISDEFELNKKQTPKFVTQGSHTEVFIQSNDELVKELDIESYTNFIKVDEKEESFLQRIYEDAKKYCSEKEVIEIFEKIKTSIINLKIDEDMDNIFEKNIVLEENIRIPQKEKIGKWINKQENIFAKAIYTKQKYQELKPKQTKGTFLLNLSLNQDDYEYVDSYKYEITDFEITTNLPLEKVEINLLPKYNNLSKISIYFVPLISKTTLYIFLGTLKYSVENWNDYNPLTGDFEWKMEKLNLKEKELETLVVQYINDILETIKEEIALKFSSNHSNN